MKQKNVLQRYGVNEIFKSIQGEGIWTGTPALFLRLQGCNHKCSWCDSKHTWSFHSEVITLNEMLQKKYSSPGYATVNKSLLGRLVRNMFDENHIVITGGEPMIYDLNPLITELQERFVQIETSGSVLIKRNTGAFITLSPKPGVTLKDNFKLCDEIKLVVRDMKSIDYLEQVVLPSIECHTIMGWSGSRVFLQPDDLKKESTQICIEYAKKYNIRVSFQVHKLLGLR